MKKLVINIIIIIIIILGTIVIQHKFFPTIIDESTHTSDIMWKDSIQVEYYPKAYPVYIDTGSVKILELPIDSAAITKAYLALHKEFNIIYSYKDTLKNDTLAFITVDTDITQNKPIKYTLGYFDRTPSFINNTTNIYHQNEFYLGLEVGQEELSTNLLFKSKKGYIFRIGFDPVRTTFQVKGYVNLNNIKLW